MIGRYAYEEKKIVVEEYFNGLTIDELAEKYEVSNATIYRWIKNHNSKHSKKERIIDKHIPVEIQKKITDDLKKNAILYGFNISKWRECMVIKYVNDKYKIKLTRYEAQIYIMNNSEENKESHVICEEELEYLKEKGLAFIHYVPIGIILSDNEGNEYKYKSYAYLIVCIVSEKLYMSFIYTEFEIVKSNKKEIRLSLIKKIKDERAERILIRANKNFFRDDVKKYIPKGTIFVVEEDRDVYIINSGNKKYMDEKKDIFYLAEKKGHMKTLYTTTNIYLLQYCENINTEGNWITNKEDLEQKVENSLKKAYKDSVIFI